MLVEKLPSAEAITLNSYAVWTGIEAKSTCAVRFHRVNLLCFLSVSSKLEPLRVPSRARWPLPTAVMVRHQLKMHRKYDMHTHVLVRMRTCTYTLQQWAWALQTRDKLSTYLVTCVEDLRLQASKWIGSTTSKLLGRVVLLDVIVSVIYYTKQLEAFNNEAEPSKIFNQYKRFIFIA